MAGYQLSKTGPQINQILQDVGELQSALDGKVNTTDIATTSDLGLVKPDGTSITIDEDGTIHSVGGGEITFTKTSTVTTVNSFKARVVDGFIIISYAFGVASVTSGTWVTLGTLSQAPSARGARQNAVRTFNGTYAGMTVLETDGRFMFYPTQSFSKNDLEGSYICIL